MDRLLNQEPVSSTPAEKWRADLERVFQHYLDKTVPHFAGRWIGFGILVALYFLRVYQVQGFYIVTYGLGIYIINQLMGFLSPQADPDSDPTLPLKDTDEFKPFIRKLLEFKFWYGLTKAFIVAFVMTFLPFFDIPVFWPILVVYWLVLFSLTMRNRISHMIKHKYIPFSLGKKRYTGSKKKGTMSRD